MYKNESYIISSCLSAKHKKCMCWVNFLFFSRSKNVLYSVTWWLGTVGCLQIFIFTGTKNIVKFMENSVIQQENMEGKYKQAKMSKDRGTPVIKIIFAPVIFTYFKGCIPQFLFTASLQQALWYVFYVLYIQYISSRFKGSAQTHRCSHRVYSVIRSTWAPNSHETFQGEI